MIGRPSRNSKSYVGLIRRACWRPLERHLTEQPTLLSRTAIKKLDPPVLATHRLRVGDYRVFYNVDEAASTVQVVAVRWKGGTTLEEAASGEGH